MIAELTLLSVFPSCRYHRWRIWCFCVCVCVCLFANRAENQSSGKEQALETITSGTQLHIMTPFTSVVLTTVYSCKTHFNHCVIKNIIIIILIIIIIILIFIVAVYRSSTAFCTMYRLWSFQSIHRHAVCKSSPHYFWIAEASLAVADVRRK